MKLSEYDTHCPTCDAPEPWHTATCAVAHVKAGEPSDAQIQAVATAIYYVPAAHGSERQNNLTWDEAKWYARTALRAVGLRDE